MEIRGDTPSAHAGMEMMTSTAIVMKVIDVSDKIGATVAAAGSATPIPT